MAGGYTHQTAGTTDAIPARLRAMQAQIDILRRSITGLGIQIDGPTHDLIINDNVVRSANFDGTINPTAAGTQGWGMGGPDGDAVFNNITLRGGIIGDDALTSPVLPRIANNEDSADPLFTTSEADYAGVSVTVPAGFTSALVMAVATASVRGTVSGGSSFSVRAKVGTTTSQQISGQAATNGLASATAALAWSGSVSGTVTAAATVVAQAPSVIGLGIAQVAMTVLFLR